MDIYIQSGVCMCMWVWCI